MLGYNGQERYVGMFWSDEADEVVLTDGQERRVGDSLRFLDYFGHASVESELGEFNLGLFGERASEWLLLDRHTRNLYIAPEKVVRTFLESQCPITATEIFRIAVRDDVQETIEHGDTDSERLTEYLDCFLAAVDEE